MEQNREPRNKPTPLIFDRGSKHMQWAKDSLFNKWCWENWTDTSRKIKLDHLLTSHTRINSKWNKDLNVRPKTIKILDKNIGSKILDITHRSFLSGISPQTGKTKGKIKQWDYIKLKIFAQQKKSSTK